MKSKIALALAAVAAVMVIVFGFSVFAETPEYELSVPEELIGEYSSGNMKKTAKIIGISPEDLKKQCKENNVVFFAVNRDNTVQVRLSSYKTEASKKAGDLSDMSDEELKLLSGDISDNGYKKTVIGGTVFLMTEQNLSDNGGEYVSRQYFTVKNGAVYQLSSYVSKKVDGAAADGFIYGFKFVQKPVYSSKQKIVIGIVIAALLILIGVMIYGIVKDMMKKEN